MNSRALLLRVRSKRALILAALDEWTERTTPENVEYAFREAAERNHRSWRYVEAILLRLEGAPFDTTAFFARRYEETVPDSWDTMHPDDVVTKGGKFFYMFKRGGRRCFLTKGGPIVQPSYMTRVTLRQLHSSIQRHLLPSYAESLVMMLTQHGLVDWSTPDKQRTRLAVTNKKVFKHLQKNFVTEKRALDLARKRVIDLGADDGDNAQDTDDDIDLATGQRGIRRLDSTMVAGSADARARAGKTGTRWRRPPA